MSRYLGHIIAGLLLIALGADCLGKLPPGVEAMLVIGSADKHTLHLTDGFKALLADWPEGI